MFLDHVDLKHLITILSDSRILILISADSGELLGYLWTKSQVMDILHRIIWGSFLVSKSSFTCHRPADRCIDYGFVHK